MINDTRIKRFKKTLEIKQILILTFFVLSELAFGQIKGVVVDQQNETPIEYATIVLKSGDEVISGTISRIIYISRNTRYISTRKASCIYVFCL